MSKIIVVIFLTTLILVYFIGIPAFSSRTVAHFEPHHVRSVEKQRIFMFLHDEGHPSCYHPFKDDLDIISEITSP